MSTPNQLFNADTAAGRLGIGRTSLYGLMRDGLIGSVRIGRRRLIPESEVERFIGQHYSATYTPASNGETDTPGQEAS